MTDERDTGTGTPGQPARPDPVPAEPAAVPAEPAIPTQPAEPVVPAGPAEPAIPTQPAEPAVPAALAETVPGPAAPLVPVAPAQPGAPVPPDQRVPAAQPAQAAPPAEPVESGRPAEPVVALAGDASAPAADQPLAMEDPPNGPAGTARRRLSGAGAVIALLLGLLGFALVVQLRSNSRDAELAAARPEDLVRILSDLDARQDRLRSEIAGLEETQRQLESGAQGREAALDEARRRADELGILAGTLPAEGPGLQIRFTAGNEPIRADAVLNAVEELRGAGAEAMQIAGEGGAPVRIVASTYFTAAGNGLLVDGQQLAAPYTVIAIGDPQTMHTALNIPGGVVDTVRQHGGNVTVQQPGVLRVTALRTTVSLKYARPAS